MSPGKTKGTLAEKDELLHRPAIDSNWRESYYFNWVDLQNKVSGFSTIGLTPNEKKREFVLALFVDNQTEVHYHEPELTEYTSDINAMLQDGKLAYKLLTPFKLWQLNYNSRKLKFELTFKARFPTYNFATDSSGSWHHHFEASGIIKGRIEYANGTTRNVNGYGQRDKSWGQRDWHKFDHWFAGQFQFKNWTCAFRKDYLQGRIDLSGYVASKDGSYPLGQMEVETVDDNDRFNTPKFSTYVLSDSKGDRHVIESERIGMNTYFRFARNFPEGYTELFEQMVIMKDKDTGEVGSGMSEYLRTHRN